MASGVRPGMGLPSGPRAATAVAALHALQPALCRCLRAATAPASPQPLSLGLTSRPPPRWPPHRWPPRRRRLSRAESAVVSATPTATIVIPTKRRPEYLEV